MHTPPDGKAKRRGGRGYYGGRGSRGGVLPFIPLPITGALGPFTVATIISSFRLLNFPAVGTRVVPHLRPYPCERS
jgi:hypothetical protein